jgi:CheY-specific phosphatase CheX
MMWPKPVICGQATTQMSKNTSRDFSLALPSIITGFGHIITQRSDTPCLVIVFEADEKPFAVQVAISMK